MPTMTDLARVKASAAMKSAEIGELFQQADAAPEGKRDSILRAIQKANDELADLADQSEKIDHAIKTDRAFRAAMRQPV